MWEKHYSKWGGWLCDEIFEEHSKRFLMTHFQHGKQVFIIPECDATIKELNLHRDTLLNSKYDFDVEIVWGGRAKFRKFIEESHKKLDSIFVAAADYLIFKCCLNLT